MINKHLTKKKEKQEQNNYREDAFVGSINQQTLSKKNEIASGKDAGTLTTKKRVRYWENTILNTEDAGEIVD